MANRRGEELTDEQWELLGPLIPELVRRADGRGRPWRENREVLEALAQDLKERGELDLSECFIDGTFIVAKKGANTLARPSGAKARSSWWVPSGQSRRCWSSSRPLHNECFAT